MAYKRVSPQPVVEGGTGAATLTAHGVLLGEGTSAVVATTAGTNGQVLLGSTAADPAFITPTAGSGLSITTNATTLAYAISAPVSIANGGTNATSMTNTDGVVYYDGTRLVTTAVGTATQVLTSNGAGVAPTFQAAGSSSITITGDSGGGLTGTSFTFTGGTTGLTFAGAGSTETLGGTLAIANGGTNATSMSTSTGIVKYDGTRLVTSSTAKIDSSNRMTNTSQPAFNWYNSSNQTNATGDGTNVTITFDTQTFQQGSNFASNTFTAPIAGIYRFIAQVTIFNVGVAHTGGLFAFQCSNTIYNTNGFFNPGTMRELQSGNNIVTITMTQLASLAASATMSVLISVSGSTKTVGIIGTQNDTFFTGELIC
jgi:hypothetical protein